MGRFTLGNAGVGLYPSRSGGLWVPGDYLYSTEGSRVTRFDAPQLDAIRVNSVFEDSRGRTWFALDQYGLALMGSGPVAENWRTPSSLGEISSIVRGSPSTLYASTSKGAILARRGAEDWRPVSSGEGGLKVVRLAPGDGGTLFGLVSVGPPVRLTANGKVIETLHPPPDMMLSSLRPLVRAPDGTYLIGSMQQRPSNLYRVKGGLIQELPLSGVNGNVQDIVPDSKGRIWVGFADGICRIGKAACDAALARADGLLANVVRTLGAGPPDELWVAYRDNNAFSRFRFADGKWGTRHFSAEEGYAAAETRFLRRDRRGWVWRGTSDGLFVSDGLHVEPADWVRISDRDGLPSSNLSRFGFLEDTDGSVWIGTTQGIAHLNPDPAWFQSRSQGITALTYGARKFLEPSKLPAVLEGPGEFKASISVALLPARYRLLPLDRKWHISYTGAGCGARQ